MSNKNEEWKKKLNEQHAAHLLMTEFVKREADDIARALEYIIPLKDEITYDSLENNMSVVNQTFASIALQLIHHNSNLDPNDADNMTLPVGAKKMNDTIEDMARFIQSVRTLLWMLQNKYRDDPAIKMTDQAFYDYQPQM